MTISIIPTISKKKKEYFDKIFYIYNPNNILLDIDLFRNLLNGDFYQHFLEHVRIKIKEIILNNNFNLHIDISSFTITDLCYYDEILLFAKLLHEFTDGLSIIYIYESSYIFTNLIHMISKSLNLKINDKIIFDDKKNFNCKFELNSESKF